MTNILEKIYQGVYLPQFTETPEGKAAYASLDELWEQLEKELGWDTADALRDHCIRVMHQDNIVEFRAGFRLGAALMLELLDRQ